MQERLLEAAGTVASAPGQLGAGTPFELHGLVRATLAPYPHVAYATVAADEVHLRGHADAIAAVLRSIVLPEAPPAASTAGRAPPVTVTTAVTADAAMAVITVHHAAGFTPSALGVPAAATLLALLGGSVTRTPGPPPTTFTLTLPANPLSNSSYENSLKNSDKNSLKL